MIAPEKGHLSIGGWLQASCLAAVGRSLIRREGRCFSLGKAHLDWLLAISATDSGWSGWLRSQAG